MDFTLLILLLLLHAEALVVIALLTVRRRKQSSLKTPVFIDTSVLMDGRIVAAASTGFVPSQLVIPRSVIAELQLLADGSDSDKRSRARHGLDVAAMLQDAPALARVIDDGAAEEGVDNQLLRLAKKHQGAICTIDYNLNKVAVVEGIRVLNINELAQQLRMNHLPGEKVSLAIIQKGNDAHQGVGYLSDGTMVVVEQASSDINKQVEVEFIRSIQTAAGRMLFAKKVVGANGSGSAHRQKVGKKQVSGKKPTSKTARVRKIVKPEDSLIELVNRQN